MADPGDAGSSEVAKGNIFSIASEFEVASRLFP
jgi:hypothetical protein